MLDVTLVSQFMGRGKNDDIIPYHAASRPRVIDKNQPIKSLEFRVWMQSMNL